MSYSIKYTRKYVLPSILVATPLLTTVSMNVQAASLTYSQVQSKILALPDTISMKNETGKDFYDTYTGYTALTGSNKNKISKEATDKYQNLVNQIGEELKSVKEVPGLTMEAYVTTYFKKIYSAIDGQKNMKAYDQIKTNDYSNLNTLYTTNISGLPIEYYETYVAPHMLTYSLEDIKQAFIKAEVLNKVNTLNTNIEKLPTIDNITLDNKTKMKNALNSYNHVLATTYGQQILEEQTDTQLKQAKEIVDNYHAYAKKYRSLEGEDVQAINDLMNSIGTVDNVQVKDQENLVDAQTKYNNLIMPESQQAINSVVLKQMYEASNLAAGNEVNKRIEEIGTVDDVALEDEEEVLAIQQAYNDLPTARAKGRVLQYEEFLKMQPRIEQLKQAQSIDEQISKLPLPDTLTASDYATIRNIRIAIDKLDPKVQETISNLTLFKEIETAVKGLDQDSALATFNNSSGTDLNELSNLVAMYNLLDSDHRQQANENTVNELERMIIAQAKEKNITQLILFYEQMNDFMMSKQVLYEDWKNIKMQIEQQEKDLQDAENLNFKINQLPLPTGVSLEDVTRVEAVTKQYEELNENAKANIDKDYVTKLTDLKQKIIHLQNEQSATVIETLIDEMPSNITLEEKSDVQNIRIEYEKISKDAQLLVSNIDRLTEAEQIIGNLEEAERITEQQIIERYLTDFNDKIAAINIDRLDIIDVENIQKLRDEYDGLTKEEQNQIIHYTQLGKAEDKIQSLYAEVTSIEELINSLNPMDNPELVEIARMLYEQLTPYQQLNVRNIETLELYEFFLAEGMGQNISSVDESYKEKVENAVNIQNPMLANKVYDLIYQLPALNELTLLDRLKVKQARESYEQLSPALQEKVLNVEDLVAAEAKMTTLEAEVNKKVVPIIQSIQSLSEELTDEDLQKIIVIRKDIDQLSLIEQSYITNYDIFSTLEDKASALNSTEGKSVKQLILFIDVLPNVEELSLDYASAVFELRDKFEKLTADQQKQVTNKSKLAEAIEKINELQEVATSLDTGYEDETESNPFEIGNVDVFTKIIEGIANGADTIALYNDKEKLAEVKVSKEGKFKFNIARQAANTILTIKLLQDNEVIDEEQFTVKAVKGQLTVPKITNMTTQLTGTATPNAKVYVYQGKKKIDSITANKKGVYKLEIGHQKKDTKLTIVEKVDNVILSEKELVVKAEKVNAATSLKAKTNKLLGKAEKNTVIKVYSGKKKIKEIKHKKSGEFNIKLPNIKKGEKLKVVVYDIAGNASSAKIVKVK